MLTFLYALGIGIVFNFSEGSMPLVFVDGPNISDFSFKKNPID